MGVKEMSIVFLGFGQANQTNPKKCYRRGEIDSCLLFLRLDLEQNHVFWICIGDNRPAQQLDVRLIFDSAERRCPMPRNGWISLPHAVQKQQLKAEQAWKCLKLN